MSSFEDQLITLVISEFLFQTGFEETRDDNLGTIYMNKVYNFTLLGILDSLSRIKRSSLLNLIQNHTRYREKRKINKQIASVLT